MGEIVNLNQARKARTREEGAVQAAANRVRFGRDKAAIAREELDQARRERLLDGARHPTSNDPSTTDRE